VAQALETLTVIFMLKMTTDKIFWQLFCFLQIQRCFKILKSKHKTTCIRATVMAFFSFVTRTFQFGGNAFTFQQESRNGNNF